MNSNKWVVNYFSETLLEIDPLIDKTIFYKSIGEFTLFCYLLKRNDLLISDYLNLINKASKLDYKDYVGGIYIKKLIAICLDINYCNNNKEIIEDYSSIEELYFISIFNSINCNKEWDQQVLEFISVIKKEGLDIKSLYHLTHLIFFSSNFGFNMYWIKCDNQIKRVIIDILYLGLSKCKISQNWDLLNELYLCFIFIEKEFITNFSQEIFSSFSLYKSKYGWYLSDGNNLKFYEDNFSKLNFKHLYSIFHTTIITELLITELNVKRGLLSI